LQPAQAFATIFITMKYPHIICHVFYINFFSKKMILNVEKIHAIKFQQLMMVPFGNTKMHYEAL
jgi:hypothetical protein